MTQPAIKTALLSTSDKTHLVEFAQALHELHIEILATGGTAKILRDHHIPITDVSDYTGFPEIMDGRVKTLHPKIHGGLLARRGQDDKVLAEHAINPIDLVAVNLYPFQKTIQNGCTLPEAIEQIDIGGPTMLRSAAKNHEFVTVVIDPNDYNTVIDEIKNKGQTSPTTRRKLANKVFQHTASYDQAIANYLTDQNEKPNHLSLNWPKKMDLRYGENPQQSAALYINPNAAPGGIAQAQLLQGKPLSYNNLADSDAALAMVRALPKDQPACVIVKHATPCGVAQADTLITAYERALATDPVSAFGGIIAFNQELDAATSEKIIAQQFVEVVLAPSISQSALKVWSTKPNCRILACGASTEDTTPVMQSISGGLLLQDPDVVQPSIELNVVSQRVPTDAEWRDLQFAWRVVQFVKSNAIVYAKDGMTLGIGSGQTSRVFSAKIAALKAQEAQLDLTNAVVASDAFFPFADGVEVANHYGIRAIIQPGGSKRDAEVIAAADAADMAMVLTGIRHFRH